jgi:hypothetical protein
MIAHGFISRPSKARLRVRMPLATPGLFASLADCAGDAVWPGMPGKPISFSETRGEQALANSGMAIASAAPAHSLKVVMA